MEDIGEPEFNRRENEVHELVMEKLRDKQTGTVQMAKEINDYHKDISIDRKNENMSVIWKVISSPGRYWYSAMK